MEETMNVLVVNRNGKSKSYQKKYHSRTLKVNVKDIVRISKDFNLVRLPFFYFGKLSKTKQYTNIIYNFEGKDTQMIVHSLAGGVVPSQFDYDVMQVLLKFREAYKREGGGTNIIEFSTWDVAKELGILFKNKDGKLCWTSKIKERISQSIARLVETNYEIKNLYTVKDEYGVRQLEKYVKFHLLDRIAAKDDLFGKDRLFSIKFNDLFINAIDKEYKWDYEVAKLESITKSTARRLFEIIDTKRNSLQYYFSYDDIAWRIPLTSNRMNKVCINGYLEHLKEVHAIHDYAVDRRHNQPDKDYFTVHFIKDTKARQSKLTNDLDINKTPLLRSITTNIHKNKSLETNPNLIVEGEFTETETLFPLSQVQNSTVIESTLKEYNHEAYLADVSELYSVSGLTEDLFVSNLLYSLKNHRKDGKFMPYLKGAIANDWAKDERIKTALEAKLIQEQTEQLAKAKQAQAERDHQRQAAQQAEIDKELAEDQKCRDIFETLPDSEQKQLLADAEQKITSVFRSLSATSKLRQDAIWDEAKQMLMVEVGP